jgi:hypothetical protein
MPEMGMKVSLVGATELVSAMKFLTQAVQNQVITKAVNKAGRIMVPPLRRATPKSKGKRGGTHVSGTMRKSVGIAVRTYKTRGVAIGFVGHRWPAGAAAHLIEGGTKSRTTKKGQNRGAVKASPFFRPVWEQCRQKVASELNRQLADGIEKARSKAAMKALKKAVNK